MSDNNWQNLRPMIERKENIILGPTKVRELLDELESWDRLVTTQQTLIDQLEKEALTAQGLIRGLHWERDRLERIVTLWKPLLQEIAGDVKHQYCYEASDALETAETIMTAGSETK